MLPTRPQWARPEPEVEPAEPAPAQRSWHRTANPTFRDPCGPRDGGPLSPQYPRPRWQRLIRGRSRTASVTSSEGCCPLHPYHCRPCLL